MGIICRGNSNQHCCVWYSREARCLEVEPFLPWLETIAEKAEAERIDQTTAAYRVASELRFYRQFSGIQKAIEQA